MAYFPQFSNFKPHVQSKLNSRKDNSIGVSQLNAWVRITSGVGNGLIMTSNPDYQLFRAAGVDSGIYDGAGGNSTIGVDWNGGGVSVGGGNLLRPKPVVTSVEVDEGAGGISRKATISITAFTLGQMETVCEYFLEPGYTVFLEFGWNTPDSVTGLVTIDATNGVGNVAGMQNFDKVNKKRETSNGDYENYLGYVTGGSVSFSDGKWNITTNLTGFTELPFYLQSHKSQLQAIGSGSIDSSTLNYLPSEINNEQSYAKKSFKIMFNDLPAERKNVTVKQLEPLFDKDWIFINFDDEIKDIINSNFSSIKTKTAGSNVNNVSYKLESEGTKVVGDERFIRLGNLIPLLTASTISSFTLEDGTDVRINFDISETLISAHKHIFSTDKSKLFIPNPQTPKFSLDGIEGYVNNGIGVLSGGINDGKSAINFPAQTDVPSGLSIKKSAYNWGYLRDLYINFDFVKDIIGTANLTIKDVIYQILNGASSAVNSQWDFQIQEAPLKNGVINLQIVDLNLVSETDNTNMYEFNLSGNDSIFIESSFDMDIGGQMMSKIIGERLGINAQPELTRVGFFSDKEDKILNEIKRTKPVAADTGASTTSGTSGTSGISGTDSSSINYVPYYVPYAGGTLPGAGLTDTKSIERARLLNEQRVEEINVEKQRISQFLGKIAYYPRIIPKDIRAARLESVGDTVDSTDEINLLCYAAVYDDTVLLDGYKQKTQSRSGYSPILPVKFSFTIHGISGIQRGDKFKVRGIPKTFYDRGFFQVTSIKHTLDGMMWKTSVEGSFRNQL